jgi:predicted N-acetyltransferase YhbS
VSPRIDYLCDHATLAPALARAHFDAFHQLLPAWTEDEALHELRSHDARRAIPTTLVALREDQWLGSVSLLQNDHDEIRDWSPWLASLYVRPEVRGSGLARALVARCCDEARALGIATLYLYCEARLVDFYLALGWRRHDRVALFGATVEVMAFDTVARGDA